VRVSEYFLYTNVREEQDNGIGDFSEPEEYRFDKGHGAAKAAIAAAGAAVMLRLSRSPHSPSTEKWLP
jgi:hypothetical protein